MPVRDIHHYNVKKALIKDGWTITHDPLRLSFGGKDMYVDLGAEHGIANELIKSGITKDKIVLGFKPPKIRPYTEYAAV